MRGEVVRIQNAALPFSGSRDIVRLRFHFTSYALSEVVRCRWVFRGCDLSPRSTANSITGTAGGCDAVHCGSNPSANSARQGGTHGEAGSEFSCEPNRSADTATGSCAPV